MKLLVFAPTPPPLHGQAYLVQPMLTGLGGDHRGHRQAPVPRNPAGDVYGIECYHVNARRRRSIPELRDTDYPSLIPPRDPQKIADALV